MNCYPGKQTEKIMEKVELEDAEIHQVKRSMVRLMAAECTNTNEVIKNPREREMSQLIQIKNSCKVKRRLNSPTKEPFDASMCEERLKEGSENELQRIGTRLENQLGKSRTYDDYVVAASQLRALSLQVKAEAVSALIDAERDPKWGGGYKLRGIKPSAHYGLGN